MTALIHSRALRVAARVNWGRWIADCLWCSGAMALAPGTSAFDCMSCGATLEVVWPSDETVFSVARLLMMRPDPNTRNWEPGEPLRQLMIENETHGIFDHLMEGGARGSLLTVTDNYDGDTDAGTGGQITNDKLPVLALHRGLWLPQRELEQ